MEASFHLSYTIYIKKIRVSPKIRAIFSGKFVPNAAAVLNTYKSGPGISYFIVYSFTLFSK